MSKLIVTAISIFLIFLFGMLVFLPKYRDLRILRARVLEKEMELSRREEYLSQLDFLSKKLEKYEPEMAKIDSAFPENPNIPLLFEFLQKICSQNGLVFKEVGAFSTSAAQDLKGIEQTSVEFKISGTIEAFLDFLERLEKSARLIEICSVSFKQPEQGNVFSFDIAAKVYSQE